jgi:hypothetical protein
MLIIPYFIHVFAIASKKTYQIYSQNKEDNVFLDSEDNVFLDSYSNTLQNLSGNSRIYVLSDGSGRIGLWKKSLKPITDNFLIGYGPQADRILIAENISNIFLYSLLCGGILAFIFILLIIINILNIILYLAFVKKYFFNKKNIIVNSSIFFIIFLLFRSLFENSFAIFGFDFMIFIICCTILHNYTKISFYSCLKNNLNLFFKEVTKGKFINATPSSLRRSKTFLKFLSGSNKCSITIIIIKICMVLFLAGKSPSKSHSM